MKFYVFFVSFLYVLNSYSQESVGHNHDMNMEKELGSWDIKNGILIENKSEETKKALECWKVFYKVFPKKLTQKYLKKIVLFTDGVDEKTGALSALNFTNTEWQLSLDIKDVDFSSNKKERLFQSIYTLLHEFGHLLTLNDTQIKPTAKKRQEGDDPYLTFEGQALKKSYMNLFVSRFWNNGLLKEWDVIQRKYCVTEQTRCLEKLHDLYRDNYNDFITDYAAESPEEDIVESWVAFVLYEKVKKPETVAQQKINFFYQFPELVKYRKIIKRNIRQYIEK